MRSAHRYIIYIIIVIIFATGLALLAWRAQVFDSLYVNSGLEQVEILGQTAAANIEATENLNNDLLESGKFLVLKNNVNQFNFDYICLDASNLPTKEGQTTDIGLPATSGSAAVCALGNRNLFPAVSLDQKK